jgi:UDP-glucose 4-epimerase
MNILITGGAGYIGSHTALQLIDKEHKVTIIDNLINGSTKLIPYNADFLKADISDKKLVKELLKKNNFDLVMHFAGLVKVEESIKYPEKYKLNNVDKTKQFFNLCLDSGLNNIIFSSTAGIYGKVLKNNEVNEMDKLDPSNPYTSSKLSIEKFLLELSSRDKINFIILRYFNVAGADEKKRSGLVSKNSNNLIKVICEVASGKKEKIIINGEDYDTRDGSTVRDFIHVSDLAEIHINVAEYLKNGGSSEIYNCGYGQGYSVKEVVAEMEKIINRKLKVEIGPRRESDIPYSVANSDKFKKKFNWKPKYNNLNYILKTALNWEKLFK